MFNVKKKIFVKNRETFHNSTYIKYLKNKHLNFNILKTCYFKKNFFKKKIFWIKFKKLNINLYLKQKDLDQEVLDFENASFLHKKVMLLKQK